MGAGILSKKSIDTARIEFLIDHATMQVTDEGVSLTIPYVDKRSECGVVSAIDAAMDAEPTP